MTNYIISENNIDEIVFKYLDLMLEGLVKKRPEYYTGIILGYPKEQYGLLGYYPNNNYGILHISYTLSERISSMFGLNEKDSLSVIGRWTSDRYQLKVADSVMNSVWDMWRLETSNLPLYL